MNHPDLHIPNAFSLIAPIFGDFHRKSVLWGGIIGMIIGLLPKGNLLTLFFLILLLVLRTNLIVGFISALVFTLVGAVSIPFADRIGSFLLSGKTAQAYGSYMFTLPLVAWTELNNTVVLGQSIIGSAFFLPAYFALNTALKKLGFTDPLKLRKPAPEAEPIEPLTKVDVLYTVPVEYKTPDFFRPSTGDTGRFTTKH